MTGVEVPALARLTGAAGVPLIHDLGSGTLVDLGQWGIRPEPTVREAVAAGADLVTFSGDKLLGGPQAGFIVGRRDLVEAIKRNPMKRALRLDKMRHAALEATLRLYREPERLAERLPTLRLLARPLPEIRALAEGLRGPVADRLGVDIDVTVLSCDSQIGSGAMPLETLPSFGLALRPRDAERERFRLAVDRAHAEHPDELGVGIDRLRLQVAPRPALPPGRDMLARRQAEGALTVNSGRVRRPGHAPRLTERDEALWSRIWPQPTGKARFRPPRTRDLAGTFGVPEEDMRKLLKRAARMGRVHEVAQDSFFATPFLAEIVAILIRVEGASGRPFSAADLRNQLQNGRKVAIEILEFLDRHGVTRRRGDQRRLDPRRIDLFGPPPFIWAQTGEGPATCA